MSRCIVQNMIWIQVAMISYISADLFLFFHEENHCLSSTLQTCFSKIMDDGRKTMHFYQQIALIWWPTNVLGQKRMIELTQASLKHVSDITTIKLKAGKISVKQAKFRRPEQSIRLNLSLKCARCTEENGAEQVTHI